MTNKKEQQSQSLSYSQSQLTQLMCSGSFMHIKNHISPTMLKYNIIFWHVHLLQWLVKAQKSSAYKNRM